MCGIVGIILNNNKIHINQNTIIKMTRELSNRGPDDEGYWVSEDQKCYLGHRRLSIIELSDKGSQPMCSKSKRFVITFNGEIYNHLSVRELLNKSFDIKWNSNSDTETLLESFDRIGVVKTLESIQGMFAFAVIDKLTKKLYLARDPFGEKPLYYGYIDNCLIFASELKPFFLYPYFKKEINYEALNYYLEYS